MRPSDFVVLFGEGDDDLHAHLSSPAKPSVILVLQPQARSAPLLGPGCSWTDELWIRVLLPAVSVPFWGSLAGEPSLIPVLLHAAQRQQCAASRCCLGHSFWGPGCWSHSQEGECNAQVLHIKPHCMPSPAGPLFWRPKS